MSQTEHDKTTNRVHWTQFKPSDSDIVSIVSLEGWMGTYPVNASRQQQISYLRSQGWRSEEIANRLGITRQRAHQIAQGGKP